ncbi:hypothetical protein M407DRAFT_245408 [Tulasnella calospora MUT 4182]|uniref:Uncharacterized protein n=1 Tax=Tulasnella calospora MUT 4182 TaxID=1051891 RepID=A0A0C3LJW5_9AGAM|nr:hypothetical protein M407DRAFT_245408 [Tulasnella calospora MUT 4182]
MTMNGFDPTSEGIDKKLALHFYSRWKFVDELLPLLEKASSDGEEARMMSILAPGTSLGALDTTDFGLKKNYSVTRAARQGPGYNDNFVAEYAARHPNVSFIHINPGAVNSSLTQNILPWYFKPLLFPVTLFLRSISDCGEYMTSALLNPAYKTGGFWLNQSVDSISTSRLYVGDEDARQKLVEHYTKEVAF